MRNQAAFWGEMGVPLPLVLALWRSVACTMPNWAWEHLRQGIRLTGTFWNDECACLDLNEAESADTASHWKLKGWKTRLFFLGKKSMIFFPIAIK